MSRSTRFGTSALFAFGFVILFPLCTIAQSQDNITIKTVTYDELGKEILKHRGKVVVVDCWFVGCLPCYTCMQHLVTMQKKHAADGMVAITVCININEEAWAKYEQQAGTVLKKKGITARNRLLKLTFDDAAEKMHLPGGFPTVYVFNRQGKWRLFWGEDVGSVLDAWILRCLKEK